MDYFIIKDKFKFQLSRYNGLKCYHKDRGTEIKGFESLFEEEELQQFKEDLIDMREAVKESMKPERIKFDPYPIINEAVIKWGYVNDITGSLRIEQNDLNLSLSTAKIEERLQDDILEKLEEYDCDLSESSIKRKIRIVANNNRREIIEQFNTKFKFIPGKELPLDKLQIALDAYKLYDEHAAPIELDAKVLLNCMHQVKRKFYYSKPVSHPMMFCLSGGGDIGKSHFLGKVITQNIKDISAIFTPSIFEDRQHFDETIGDTFYAMIDDIDRIPDEVIGTVKALITSDEKASRTMYTKNKSITKNRSTIFATSNATLSTIIPDAEGARRYWQVFCKRLPEFQFSQMLDKIWRTVNDIDWQDVWQSINESVDNYLSDEDWAQIREHQNYWGLISPVFSFVDSNPKLFEDTDKWIRIIDILPLFLHFSEQGNRRSKIVLENFATYLCEHSKAESNKKPTEKYNRSAHMVKINNSIYLGLLRKAEAYVK